MTLVGRETKDLLTDLYKLAEMQAELKENNMALDVNWGHLHSRLQRALITEGLEIPESSKILESDGD